MPIFIHCDVCKRVMGETSIDKFKRFKKTFGERCTQCQQIMDGIDDYTKKLRKMQLRKMDEYFTETKADVAHEIQRLTQLPPKKLSLKDRIKGIFVKGRVEFHEELPPEETPDERLKDKTVDRGKK